MSSPSRPWIKGVWIQTGASFPILGKFSLAKTLGTVALGAACVAFPAVGAIACGIGAIIYAIYNKVSFKKIEEKYLEQQEGLEDFDEYLEERRKQGWF